jgi:hypothetical protein
VNLWSDLNNNYTNVLKKSKANLTLFIKVTEFLYIYIN